MTQPNKNLSGVSMPDGAMGFEQTSAKVATRQLISALKVLSSKVPPKSFLASNTIGGLSILFILCAAEILTGDFLSWNGAIKTFLLLSGAGLNVKGRVNATEPISFSLPGAQVTKKVTPLSTQENLTVRAALMVMPVGKNIGKDNESDAVPGNDGQGISGANDE